MLLRSAGMRSMHGSRHGREAPTVDDNVVVAEGVVPGQPGNVGRGRGLRRNQGGALIMTARRHKTTSQAMCMQA